MAKRELMDTGTAKRYVRRDERGRFVRSDAIGRYLSADRRTTAQDASKRRQGVKSRPTRASAGTSWFGNRPLELSVAVVAGLIAITAGAVLTFSTLGRRTTR